MIRRITYQLDRDADLALIQQIDETLHRAKAAVEAFDPEDNRRKAANKLLHGGGDLTKDEVMLSVRYFNALSAWFGGRTRAGIYTDAMREEVLSIAEGCSACGLQILKAFSAARDC